jgi:methylenetetrahydrofolate dehydrogenase (NADP+)/methenyltetrahydrofolate cyclohydrolase
MIEGDQMKATLLDGRRIAREIRQEVRHEVEDLKARGVTPSLTVVLVGDDPASNIYVSNKEKACGKVGIESSTIRLPASVSREELMSVLADLNSNRGVHGILVQLPLPSHIGAEEVLCAIDPAKDVDGFTPHNLGRLLLGFPFTIACTPAGIVELLERYDVPLEGADVVIIGRSNIVGKPLAALLLQKAKNRNCTVTVCHSRTKDIGRFTRSADVVVTAMGNPRYLKADMVKAGCTVVDVGMNRIPDPSSPKGYILVGDADFDPLTEVASHITPVPGGVGPLTVAMLMRNTVRVARSSSCDR